MKLKFSAKVADGKTVKNITFHEYFIQSKNV